MFRLGEKQDRLVAEECYSRYNGVGDFAVSVWVGGNKFSMAMDHYAVS